jgi:hypothetical protein
MENNFSGITGWLQMAKSLGRYEGLTNFLKEDNNTMTKEDIVAVLIEISDEYRGKVTKQ